MSTAREKPPTIVLAIVSAGLSLLAGWLIYSSNQNLQAALVISSVLGFATFVRLWAIDWSHQQIEKIQRDSN